MTCIVNLGYLDPPYYAEFILQFACFGDEVVIEWDAWNPVRREQDKNIFANGQDVEDSDNTCEPMDID